MQPVSYGLDWLKSPCKFCPRIEEDKTVCAPDCKPVNHFAKLLDSRASLNYGVADVEDEGYLLLM